MKVVGVHETLHELTSNAICNVQTLVFQLVSHGLTHYDCMSFNHTERFEIYTSSVKE